MHRNLPLLPCRCQYIGDFQSKQLCQHFNNTLWLAGSCKCQPFYATAMLQMYCTFKWGFTVFCTSTSILRKGGGCYHIFFSFLDFTDPILTTPGRDHEAETKPATFYTELWFVVLMAILGLVFLAVLLSLILQCKISKQPYARERPPLVPLQKRMSPMTVYSQGETHMVWYVECDIVV